MFALRGFGGKLTSGVTVAIFLSASVPAFAQAGVSEQLYREGGELMKAGKTHEACGKFAASYRADNTAVGSLLATAACHEKEGKNAAAWGEYGAVAAIAARDGQTDRQQYATDHAKALEPKLHHLVIAPAFDVANPPTGLAVQLDGAGFDPGAFNSQIPIDSGDHTLNVTATGKTPWATKFTTANDTKTDTVSVPALVDAPKDQPQTIVIKDETTTHLNKTKLALGIIFGGVGLGGIGAAIGLGLNASAVNQKAVDAGSAATACGFNNAPVTQACTDDKGHVLTGADATNAANGHHAYQVDTHSKAETSQTIAIVSGIVGGLSLIAGVFFIVTSPEKTNAAPPPSVDKPATVSNLKVIPVVSPQFNGLGLSGSF
ncbi:MAG: hypothetical protein ABI183_02420 [Polyangiaceae bacterium]